MGVNALFTFTVFVIGSILTCILIYRKKQPSTGFLAFFLFTLTITNFFLFLFESKYLLFVPFLLRWGPLINYVTAPALLFYVLYTLHESRKSRWYDGLHLVPMLVFFVDYLPLYTSSNDHKREIILGLYNNTPSALEFQEGWFVPDNWHYVLRHLIALGYVIYILALLVRHSRAGSVRLVKNTNMLHWLKLVVVFFAIFSITGIITFFFHYSPYAWLATVWEPLIMVGVLAMSLFFSPEILYGKLDTAPYANALAKTQNKSKNFVLHDDVNAELRDRLGIFMESRRFLHKNIKLSEVAGELKVQPYILSAYINHVYQMRFNDLINFWRIQYVKDGLEKGEWNLLTLEAVAEEAGFNNRTTFLNAFKKFTGMTPTAFMQKANQHNGHRNDHHITK